MPRTQKSLKNNLTTLTTSIGSTTKRKNVTKRKTSPKVVNSKKKELFPHLPRFSYAFFPGKAHEHHLNKAWFDDLDRIEDWIRKQKLKQDEYTAYHYTGKK
tara:strand:- start:2413 stop:2715 length:303 start_codon:yes stop_codon:yes gene_type:complete